MSSYSESDLSKLLINNPDLTLVPDDFDYGKNPLLAGLDAKARLKAKAPKMSEHDMQKQVFAMCDRNIAENPLWRYVIAIPNQWRKGQRPVPGMAAGFPDILVPLPAKFWDTSYLGLAIELKVYPHKPEPHQLKWHEDLRDVGYDVDVIYDNPDTVIERIAEWISFCTL